MDDGKNWLNLSIASENKYLVLKRQVEFRIMEELTLSSYQRSNPFKNVLFLFNLHLWDNQGERCSSGRQLDPCAVEFL